MFNYKKNFCTIILLIYFISLKLPVFSIEIIDPKLDFRFMKHINTYKGQTAILGLVTDYPGIYSHGAVAVYENDNWTKLPDTVYSFGKFPLPITISSSLNYDSSGNIWVSGLQLYKFVNGKWQVFSKSDPDSIWRTYQHFCIDKYNNVWVTTRVNDNSKLQYSELLRFDGEKFETVLKFDMPFSFLRRGYYGYSNGIAALPDGRIVVHRTFNKEEEDVKNERIEDLYYINQDLTYQRVKLKTPSGSKYDNFNHIISSILPEADGKIWFCLDYMILSDEMQTTCCSGLVQQYGDTWTIFDNSYGFEKVTAYPEDVYKSIYFMQKLENKDYFIWAEDCIYLLSKDYKLLKKEWSDILSNNCKFIVCNSQNNNEDFVQNIINWFYGNKSSPKPSFLGLCVQENGDIWIQLGRGIIVLNKDSILSISSINIDNTINISPNPVKETINLQTPTSTIITDYQIIDILGVVLKDRRYISNQIDISELSEGVYFIKLLDLNNEVKIIKFIKTNF